MITPSPLFRDNLLKLPGIETIERIDLVDASGIIAGTIENQAGKQGSLAVYNYLKATFGQLDAAAAEHGLAVFAEHTADAKSRPGAHPNIDRLIRIAGGDESLDLVIVPRATI